MDYYPKNKSKYFNQISKSKTIATSFEATPDDKTNTRNGINNRPFNSQNRQHIFPTGNNANLFVRAQLYGKRDLQGGYTGQDLHQLNKRGHNPMKTAFEDPNYFGSYSFDKNNSNLLSQNDIVAKPGLLITN